MNKPTKPIARNKPRRLRVAALLNVVTLVAAVVIGGLPAPKIPPLQGD